MSGGSIHLSEYVKLSNVGDGLAGMANREVSMVYMWDTGPTEPKAPLRPKAPKGEEGNPEYDLAVVEFRKALSDYDADLRSYGDRKREYALFLRDAGGPFEVKMWSVDANDALIRDGNAVADGRQEKRRWFISARTRGYETLPNGGLPGSMKPGKGHEENLRREREGDADMAAVRKQDPIFGQLERA